MRFARFRFVNFKGIRDATVDLMPDAAEGGVVTLVGLNESGKTTVLEGIDRFYPGQEDEEIKPKDLLGITRQDPFELIPIAARANFNDRVEIHATVRLDAADKEALKKGLAKKTGFVATDLPDEVEITNRYTFVNSKQKSSATYWPSVLGEGRTKQGRVLHKITSRGRSSDWNALIAVMRERLPIVWYFPNFLFEFPEEVVLNELPNETPSNRLYRMLFQDILEAIDEDMTVETHIVARALSDEGSDQQSLNQLKFAIGGEVTSTVVEQWNRMFGSTAMQGKRVFLELEKTTREGVECVAARFLLEDGAELFSIRERSLGFRWFFVYLLLTTYPGKRTGPRNLVFLLDEPASNLHSSAQALLLGSVEKLAENAQIIYTTHSHHLVNPSWLESTFVVTNEGVDPSEIDARVTAKNTHVRVERYPAFAYANPGKQHYFQPVLDVLAYRPSELELVPEVVMTEGRADFYLLTYYSRMLKSSPGPVLNFMPGRGAGTLDVVIRLYYGWARNFLVLLDNDGGGRSARVHYLKEFGAEIGARIITLDEAVDGANVKAIESLLEEEDQLAFQRLVDPTANTWNKRQWSQGVEHAVATSTPVEISATAMGRLDALIDGLHAALAKTRSGGVEGQL